MAPGAIVYGIEEDRSGAAVALSPFDTKGVPERVAAVAQNLDEPVTPVVRVLTASDGKMGYLIIEVQPSARAPHLVRGTAWGRTAGGNTELGRRQLGELFARSDGFAAEFELQMGRPGRVAFRITPEFRPNPGRSRDVRYFLTFLNDGDAPVFDASWEWEEIVGMPQPVVVGAHPFPADMNPGEELRVQIVSSSGVDTVRQAPKLRTTWLDARRQRQSMLWTATFG